MSTGQLRSLLSEPARIRALTQCIRAKIPSHDVDDVVQSTLADALSAASPPLDEPALDRWLTGIARHKVADYYRSHQRRELADADLDRHNAPIDGPPESARDLLHWVDGALPADSEASRTLEWMMREADGDRLESIAAENNLSAPAVRQRVSRLRRYLKERWALQLAAAITLFIVVGTYAYMKRTPTIEPEPTARIETPSVVAQKLRQTALEDCRGGRWQICLEKLDRAKALDPTGDAARAVVEARDDIARAMQPQPAPSTSASEERLVPAGTPLKSPSNLKAAPIRTPATGPQSDKKANPPAKPTAPLSKSNKKSDTDLDGFSSNQAPSNEKSSQQNIEQSPTQQAPVKEKSAPKKAYGKGSSLGDFGSKSK